MDPYHCELLSGHDSDDDLPETIAARSERSAAAMFKMQVSSMGRGPGKIAVTDKRGVWFLFDWDLNLLKKE